MDGVTSPSAPAAVAAEAATVDLGRALGTDYFLLRGDLTDSERDYLARTRTFVEEEVLPVINDYWERAEFPVDLCRRLGELGLVGDGIEGYGCPEMSPLAAGLINMELSRGDGSLGTFLGVQAGLAMGAIAKLGSEEQKRHWLPPLARVEKLGAFALTEPEHGSDSVALETTARRQGDEYVIDGAKRWIGNGSVADVVVVWARDTEDGQVKGFLVELPTKGYEATVIEGKVPVRAIWNAHIVLDGVRVPAENMLPGGEASRTRAASSRRRAPHAPTQRSAMPWPPTTPRSPTRGRVGSSASRSRASRSSRRSWSGCSPRSPRCSSTA